MTVTLTVNDRIVRADSGRSLLQVARDLGIEIPTLCYDPRIPPDASCSVCLVEVRSGDAWRLAHSCTTPAGEGMVVRTESAEIFRARRTAIELLLSDHYADCVAPCVLHCPAGVDIPAYVAEVRVGNYAKAVEIVRRTNPFPGVCGRVCPHPCEEACRRGVMDDALAINPLKRAATVLAERTAAGTDPGTNGATIPSTGRHVAIIGAGPAGLSAAYFLRLAGHAVTVFEAGSAAGGMLRYGIPAYRLPRSVLDADLGVLERLGVSFVFETRLGRDITIQGLLDGGHDAVLLALGAWEERRLRVPGEAAEGVVGGVAFLTRVNTGAVSSLQGRVGVVGGGNTAVDAARAALRLGADAVTILYRRTRDEMPAFPREVRAALREGVVLESLVSPVAIEVEAGRVRGIRLQRMVLGEADSSGRPRPIPVVGSEHLIPVDHVINAIGEVADLGALDERGAELTRGGPVADARTSATARPGVFAAGDFVTGGGSAVEAVAAGRRAAESIDAWLRTGEVAPPRTPIYSRRDVLGEVRAADLPEARPARRAAMPERVGPERLNGFAEVELGLGEEVARREAQRCLQCGCASFDTCDLRRLMEVYRARPDRLAGEVHRYRVEDLRPGIRLDMNKCIRCARCVRICETVADVGAIGFVSRGFAERLVFAPGMDPGAHARCDACLASGALCADTCPTGALTVTDPEAKLEDEDLPLVASEGG